MKEIAIDAESLKYTYPLQLAGAQCIVRTNSAALGKTLSFWRGANEVAGVHAFSMNVLVAGNKTVGPASPHFRGLHHLVIASFGSSNVFVFDLLRRNVTAMASIDIAEDHLFWDRTLLPITMGVLGAAVGVVPVHCACLSLDGEGLLIAGESGAGKSTLAFALAQDGFEFISDDWAYLSEEHGRLMAHGMSVPVKLLPDAIDHFPRLAGYPIRMALNNELAYDVPAEELGAQVRLSVSPRWFLFLQRTGGYECQLDPISADDALRYIGESVEPLPAQLSEIEHARSAIINQVSRLSCFRFRYGGPPEVAVQGLRDFMSRITLGITA